MKTIAIANQKGGVGKSTTTITLGSALAMDGAQVLLIDADHQAHTTKGLAVEPKENTISELLTKESVRPNDVIVPTKEDGLFVIPSNLNLAMTEMKLSLMGAKEYRLRKKVYSEEIRGRFDYCLIDCPPTFGNICMNAFLACDWVLMPIQLGYFSMEGVDSFIETINYVNKEMGDLVNHRCKFLGVLINLFDKRTNLSKTVMEKLEEVFEDLIFKTRIPVNIKLNESQLLGVSVFEHDPLCKGAEAYMDLKEEVLLRLKGLKT